MTKNTHFPDFSGLSGQMQKAWQDLLDAWWKTLLKDSSRLSDLATELGIPQAKSHDELPRILTALELMEQRQAKLEKQVQELTRTLDMVVGHLEKNPPA